MCWSRLEVMLLSKEFIQEAHASSYNGIGGYYSGKSLYNTANTNF
jgi:hypothetical protein